MITLQDQANAHYLDGGKTVPSGLNINLPNLTVGKFHVYLGILTPTALRMVPNPNSEEVMNGYLSGFLKTLFEGLVSGTGLPKLGNIVRHALKERAMVKTHSSFTQALNTTKSLPGNWCLPFELIVTPAKEMLVKSHPFNLQVTQANQRLYNMAFKADIPARIHVSDGAAQPIFNLVVISK